MRQQNSKSAKQQNSKYNIVIVTLLYTYIVTMTILYTYNIVGINKQWF